MKKMMLIALCAFLAPLASLYADGIGGTYSCEGRNPSGSGRYQGTVVITGDASSGYTFNWTIGESQFSGTGTLAEDVLTVDWGEPDPVVYKVKDDGAVLKGKWGPGGKGRETLTRE